MRRELGWDRFSWLCHRRLCCIGMGRQSVAAWIFFIGFEPASYGFALKFDNRMLVGGQRQPKLRKLRSGYLTSIGLEGCLGKLPPSTVQWTIPAQERAFPLPPFNQDATDRTGPEVVGCLFVRTCLTQRFRLSLGIPEKSPAEENPY